MRFVAIETFEIYFAEEAWSSLNETGNYANISMPEQFYCDSLTKPLSQRKITLFVGVTKKKNF